MNKTNCPICSAALKESFVAKVLQKYDAVFKYCSNCGFLCAEDPFWLEESYSSAIASTDTGLVARNLALSKIIAVILYFLLGERGEGRCVDVAGGYGMLTRLMRDYGFDFYWADKYCQNILARGFEYTPEMGNCRAVTAIEVMEHAENPMEFIQEALAFAQSDTLIFTTELFDGNPPQPDQWWYYSFKTGQHISFYQKKTLETLAARLGMMYFCVDEIHLISKIPISVNKIVHGWRIISYFRLLAVKHRLSSRQITDHLELMDRM